MKRRRFCAAFAAAGLGRPAAAALPAGLTLLDGTSATSEPLFSARLIGLDGQASRVPRTPGRVMVVNFWARWCGPCKVEIPELVALHQRNPALQVLGIAIENDPAAVRDFTRAYEMSYPVLLAREGGIELMRALGNAQAGLPFTLVLDGRGAPAAMRLGLMTREQLDAAVQVAIR